MQQKTQCDPEESRRGEAPRQPRQGLKPPEAAGTGKSEVSLMEAILSQENLKQALKSESQQRRAGSELRIRGPVRILPPRL